MIIIRHRVNSIRGLLATPKEYGVEIDVRSNGKRLFLNHEPSEGGEDLEEFLSHCNERFIIFNVKEAGIENEIIEFCKKYSVKNYFLLDVEFPFIYNATRKMGFKKIAIRFSEAEPIELALAQKGLCEWVWVDTNTKLPLNPENYKLLKDAGFKICLVCPERWDRKEDIDLYIDYFLKNNIKIDAVMTSINTSEKWEKMLI